MSTLKDKLAEARAKAADQTSAEEPAKTQDADAGFDAETEVNPHATEGVLGGTLVQDTATSGASSNGGTKSALDLESIAQPYQAKAGDYKNVRLHRIVLRDGTTIKPNRFGYYEGESLNEEAVDLLKNYEAKGLVTLVE